MTRRACTVIARLLPILLLGGLAGCQEDPAGPPAIPHKAAPVLAAGDDTVPPVWLHGRVRDDMGRLLAGVDVVALPGLRRTTTGPDGAYTVGPFVGGTEIWLQTESPDTISSADARDAWFDFVTDPFDPAAAPRQDILLLVRYDDIDFEFGDDTFVRYLHRSFNLSSKFDQVFPWGFPVRIYTRPDVITVTDDDGNDHTTELRALAAEAVGLWNARLGFTAMVETADSNSAQIINSLEGIGPWAYGLAILSPRNAFWRDPPERARIVLNSYFERRFHPEHRVDLMATFMHEICHALGHRGHIVVRLRDAKGNIDDDILMYTGAPDHTYQPHRFDLRVVRALKNLPSGVNFHQYETFYPSADFPPLGS